LERVGGERLNIEERAMEDQKYEDGPRPSGLMDPVIYGRRLRAARIMAGYDRVVDLVEALDRKTGVHVSERTAYAIERGEQLPSIDFFMAVIITLNIQGGIEYFLPAMTAECVAEYMKVTRP
jgi:DNA-binding XRE family transcriptional regulator